MASLLLACAVAVLPPLARLGLPHGRCVPHFARSSCCPLRMQIVWGQEPEVEERAASGAPSLMELSVSYGWCLSDVELAEMQSYQVSLPSWRGGTAATPVCQARGAFATLQPSRL